MCWSLLAGHPQESGDTPCCMIMILLLRGIFWDGAFNYVSIVQFILKSNSAFLQERLFIFASDVVYFAFQPICQTFLVVVFAIDISVFFVQCKVEG